MRDFTKEDRPALQRFDVEQINAIVDKRVSKKLDELLAQNPGLFNSPYCDSEKAMKVLSIKKTSLHYLVVSGVINVYGKKGSNRLFKLVELYEYIESTKRK